MSRQTGQRQTTGQIGQKHTKGQGGRRQTTGQEQRGETTQSDPLHFSFARGRLGVKNKT